MMIDAVLEALMVVAVGAPAIALAVAVAMLVVILCQETRPKK